LGRIDHALVYDRASESLIMFGARSTETSGADIRNETWEYRP